MQNVTTAIRPRILSDEELVRYAQYYIDVDGELTPEFQKELIQRFAEFIKY